VFLWKNRVTACQVHDVGDIALEFDTDGRVRVDVVLVAAGCASNFILTGHG